MNGWIRRPAALLLGFALASPAVADPIRTGFTTTNFSPGTDDGSLGPISLGFDANFFGTTYTSAHINVNGSVTFDAAQHTHSFDTLTSLTRKIIAPFFADVDTSVGNAINYGSLTVEGRSAFAVTWPDVGFFNQRTDFLNHFQVVLIDRADTGAGNFDIEFNYKQIQWEAGDSSGGVNGLGGPGSATARVGFSDGSGNADNAFELDGSAVPGAFLDGGPNALVSGSMNSDVTGRYIFQSRDGTIETGSVIPSGPDPEPDPEPNEPSESPEPGTLIMAGAGLAMLGGCAWRRGRRFRS